jgi:hypothetical protein
MTRRSTFMALPYVVRVPGESFSPLDSSPFQWRRGGCCLPGSSLRSVRDLENLSSADESPDQGRGEVTKSEVVRSLGRAVRRTAANQGNLLGQLIALSARCRTTPNGGVRGIFAGCEFPAESDFSVAGRRGFGPGHVCRQEMSTTTP